MSKKRNFAIFKIGIDVVMAEWEADPDDDGFYVFRCPLRILLGEGGVPFFLPWMPGCDFETPMFVHRSWIVTSTRPAKDQVESYIKQVNQYKLVVQMNLKTETEVLHEANTATIH